MLSLNQDLRGEKNAGFDVLYHNMKHGQLATKELAEFVRERAAIEETYSKSMNKLAKIASNGSQLGTFAPMWDVFRVSSDKLALCHLELMKKMNDLIRDVSKYGDEQVKVHRKTKEEMVGTVDAVQALQVQNGHLQKSKEGYHTKCLELDRLRKEGAPQKELEKAELKSKKAAESFALCIEKYNRVGGEFEQKMSESAQRFQEIEEAHLRQMKQLIKSYSHSIEDTHVQVGQVHEEFKQNVENIGIDILIQKFAELKGTGKERPGTVISFEEYMAALTPEGGKKTRTKAFRIPGLGKRDKEPDSTQSPSFRSTICHLSCFFLTLPLRCSEKEDNFYSSDSDFDDEEPKKFHIQIRPVASSSRSNSVATENELKATVGTLTLPPNRGTRQQVIPEICCIYTFYKRTNDRERKRDRSLPPPVTSDDPFAITMIGSPTHQSSLAAAAGMIPSHSSSRPVVDVASAPPKKELTHWKSVHNPFSDSSCSKSQDGGVKMEAGGGGERRKHRSSESEPRRNAPPLTRHSGPQEDLFHLSRGPSPISLSTQDALPVAAAITEYINAYFKGGQHNRCLVKITGDLMMSFPAGITRIFTANPNVPVLSFRLVNISKIDNFLPNQKLLYSDPSQSDPDSRDFWFNMQALQLYLQKEAELNPQASYYNIGVLKYQWIVVNRVLCFCVPGSGTLCASWQCLEAPHGPPPSLAVQFVGSGTSLSGMDVELVGTRYRMSLVKKRFATGKYMAGCSL
uniref:FCH and mu domain containing endocytic adaptor 1 n=1 Tax=Xiphophorus couchianus TaxID=32473 RepID=A0A3B5LV04_9TELE